MQQASRQAHAQRDQIAAGVDAGVLTEADRLAFSGQGKVPVLVDGDKVISDSWTIAYYLEDS